MHPLYLGFSIAGALNKVAILCIELPEEYRYRKTNSNDVMVLKKVDGDISVITRLAGQFTAELMAFPPAQESPSDSLSPDGLTPSLCLPTNKAHLHQYLIATVA